MKFQRFDLFRVNPPLIRSIAAIPVSLAPTEEKWNEYKPNPTERCEGAVGLDLGTANGRRYFWLVTLARWACIPFSLLGGWISGWWAMRAYGLASGILATGLWFFSPMVLGHASLITADAHSAAMGVAAMYGVWCWLRQPSWQNTFWIGLLLGLAELCKHTLLVLYPVITILWLVYRFRKTEPETEEATNAQQTVRSCGRPGFMQLAALFVVSVMTINLGYGFEGTFKRLGDYRFQSHLFTGRDESTPWPVQSGYPSRFEKTFLNSLPVPLPANYLQGIDTQRLDFERGIGASYLCGAWQERGWWYWYLCAFLFKTPLGTLALLTLAVVMTFFCRWSNAAWRDELAILLPAAAVFALVSSQTGFSIHYRYALPALPFLFIWISKTARAFVVHRKKLAVAVACLAVLTVVESLSVFPHSLSFFNRAVGGPRNGHNYLLDSNIAWGQDLFYFDRWRKEHPEASPCYLFTCYAQTSPELWEEPFDEIDYHNPDVKPGWYAVDVNFLHKDTTNEHNPFAFLSEFLHFEPVAMAGYSIYIYHITLEEANRVRRELGLPEIDEEGNISEGGNGVDIEHEITGDRHE